MSINRNALKNYAPKARREFIQAVAARAAKFGISDSEPAPMEERGDLVIIEGQPYPKRVGGQRQKLVSRIRLHGFQQTMEEVAYTWFNRLLAIRFMELHGYLDHGYRVLSHPVAQELPEILEHAEHLELPGLNNSKVIDLKLDGTKDAELYRMLLIAQCNALHRAMPFLFERIDDETELLLPDNLLHSDSLIRKLVKSIDEKDWEEIEIIGWLYQFYISEKKDQVIGKVVKSEDIPAATQLFTPNWIVKYMVQNSLGAQWLATYPDSPLKEEMAYYIEPAAQIDEVQRQLNEITPKALDPEEMTLMDPACGSGHILVEAYDFFKAVYLERGYRLRDIPRLILEKNLFGLDIDDRAAQMAGFALLMKARADDRRILSPENPPVLNVTAIQDSKGLGAEDIARTLMPKGRFELVPSDDLLPDTVLQPVLAADQANNISLSTISSLIDLFAEAKTFGSLISVTDNISQALPNLAALTYPRDTDDLYSQRARLSLCGLVQQALMLDRNYDVVIANPPYMGSRGMNPRLRKFANDYFPNSKSDLFAIFMERNLDFCIEGGFVGMITMQSWMFLSSYEALRNTVLEQKTITNLAHLGSRAFDSISGEVVSTAAFVIENVHLPDFKASFLRLVDGGSEAEKQETFFQSAANENCDCRFTASARDFEKIPNGPIAYWIGPAAFSSFEVKPRLASTCEARRGLSTGNNEEFTRQWHEVSTLNFSASRAHERTRWFPYNKGGAFRKWFGNYELVVDWECRGRRIKNQKPRDSGDRGWRTTSEEFYEKDGITWSGLTAGTVGFRWSNRGALFDTNKGPMMFPQVSDRNVVLAYLNSKVATYFINAINPTLSTQNEDIDNLPFERDLPRIVNDIAEECIRLSVEDWDSFESSWDFTQIPLLAGAHHHLSLEQNYSNLRSHWQAMTDRMRELEEKNNALFIAAFGLEDELTPDVPLSEVTLTCNPSYRYGGDVSVDVRESRLKSDIVRELISYAVGCMMGRYSLVERGLIYANAADEGFDPSRYGDFPADDDGIVPVTESEWFDDDAAFRFEEFLKAAWSTDTLEENLRFVAESLSQKGGNDTRSTIRTYFAKSFFKDHLKAYKKRPIYWLFSSGKLKAFECLVYLHRYNESTLSRMRMEYVTPLQSRMAARIDQLTDDITAASSSAARNKAQKEKDLMIKQLEELRTFGEELRHYADQRIALNLDDGVKVNYGKFGNLLAERKAIAGEK